MGKVFGHGGLRLVLLALLEDGPKHGYELIVALEQRFMGMYRPSSGTVYPRLAALEDEGLIQSEEVGGKRTYSLTDAGRAELARRRADIDETIDHATSAVRSVMETLQSDIKAAVSALQHDVRRARDDVQTEGHKAQDAVRDAARAAADEARRVRRMAEDLRRQAAAESRSMAADARETAARGRDEVEDLAAEMATWASETAERVKRFLPDDDGRARLRAAFDEMRRVFVDTLDSGGR